MSDTRERLVAAAYTLFSQRGFARSGVDRIAETANCAKASLYSIFGSKNQLAIAVLQRREELWTHGWLEAQIKQHAGQPESQLLAVFAIFDQWFRRTDFEGCTFINLMIESRTEDDVRHAAIAHLANIRSIIKKIAKEAKLEDPDSFAQTWHVLMNGTIISACEGNQDAAKGTQHIAERVLKEWPRS